MQQKIRVRNHSDAEGRPAGGTVEGVGIAIVWQDGPLGEQPASSAPVFRMGAQQAFPPDVPGHNGAFVEGVLAAAQARLEFYQASPFKCSENEVAFQAIKSAQNVLASRTSRRQMQGIEGTHALDPVAPVPAYPAG